MSTPRENARSSAEDDEVRRRVQAMRDDELIDFVRDTVAHLSALADRLEVFADEQSGDNGGNARDA